MAEARSFKYQIRKRADCVQLTIRSYQWKRFLMTSLWTALWIVAPVEVLRSSWGFNPFSYSFLLLGAFFAFIGAWSAVESLLTYKLTLYPSKLRIRKSFFGFSRSRLIPVSDVARFGFGHLSHSSKSVLCLEIHTRTGKGKWFGIARGPTKQEVDEFLDVVETEGFRLPRSLW